MKKLLLQLLVLLPLLSGMQNLESREGIYNTTSSTIYFNCSGDNTVYSIAPNAEFSVGNGRFLIYPTNNPNGPALVLDYNSNKTDDPTSAPNIVQNCTITDKKISAIDDSSLKLFKGTASVYTDSTQPTGLKITKKLFWTAICNATQKSLYIGAVGSTTLTPIPGSTLPLVTYFYPTIPGDCLVYTKNDPNGHALLLTCNTAASGGSYTAASCSVKNGSIDSSIPMGQAQACENIPHIITDSTQPSGLKIDLKDQPKINANIYNNTQSILYIGTIGSTTLTPINIATPLHETFFTGKTPETYLIYPKNDANGPALWFQYNNNQDENYVHTCSVTNGIPSFDDSQIKSFKGLADIITDSKKSCGFNIVEKKIIIPSTQLTAQANIYNNTQSTLYAGTIGSTALSEIPAASKSPNNFLTVQTPGVYLLYPKNDANGPALWLTYATDSNSASEEKNKAYKCAVIQGKVYIRDDASMKKFMGSTYILSDTSLPGILVK